MRVLLVSDLHYCLPQWDWVVRAAPRYEVVVVAGDSLDIHSQVPLDVQCIVTVRYLELLHQAGHVVVASGNHDLTGPDERGEQAALWLATARAGGVPTDGDALTVADSRFTVCPWWDGPLGKAALDRRLEHEATQRAARWLWVYHWPPLGSPTCWTGRKHYGDAELGAWIDRHQPDFVLAGHVHESPFKPAGGWADRRGRTWVFNAGRQIGPVPAYIEIDLAGGTASWHSMMGSESLALEAGASPPRTVF
jgi:Icc-related predicted phosphoesterase